MEELYAAIDTATNGVEDKAQMELVSERLAVFSIDFIILLFCFIYAFKLIGGTVSIFVQKFFPDKAFGQAQPMHYWSTAATKWAKDQVMKPVGLARDIALHQTGKAATKAVSGVVSWVRNRGNNQGRGGTPAGNTMRNAGQAVQTGAQTTRATAQGVPNNKPGNCQCRKRHKVSVTSGKRYSGCRTGYRRSGSRCRNRNGSRRENRGSGRQNRSQSG